MLSGRGLDNSESQLPFEISDSLPLSLGDCSFISDSGISIATTLVEEIIQDLSITQDSFDSSIPTNALTELEDGKSDAYKLTLVDPETADRAAHREKMKELMERRFTHTRMMTPHFSWGGRYAISYV